MKLSKKRGLILSIIVLSIAVVLYSFSVHTRMMKFYSIAGRESGFQFMSFELRNFGGDAVVVEVIEFPPQRQVGKSFVPIFSLKSFEWFRELCERPTVYTMMEPSRTDLPNNFSDNVRTLRTTYFRTYYFFNNAETVVWEYNHTIEFKVQLRGEE